ncbi:MAG: PQQ-binding-like beta-propeller repeat protein [Pirellulales bacterium]|nr:PQQ-binding-like beta-propeller repeat protein [Pirellulales bacterium]
MSITSCRFCLRSPNFLRAALWSAFVGLTWICNSAVVRADWEQFQGNAAHTGYVDSYIYAPGLTQQWFSPAPSYSAGPGDRSVAIVAGDVYATMLQGYGPVGPYLVKRLDGLTGATEWQASIPGSSHSGVSAPSVAGDTVYVHHFGHSGSSGSAFPTDYPALVGLDRASGVQQFWTTHSGQWSSGSRPTIEGTGVFAAGGYFGGLDAYGLNGSHVWFHGVNQQYGWIPAADQNNVYVYMGAASASPGPSVGSLFIVNRTTGVRDATVPHPQSNGTFYGEEQSVILGGQGDALALTYNNHPAFANSKTLVSFDIVSRTINWQITGNFGGNAAVSDGQIAVPDGNALRIVDQSTGGTLWTWTAPGAVWGNVVLSNQYAFVNAGGSVHAIDLLTRTSVWNSSGVTGSIALDDNLLVISNPSGVRAYTAIPEPASFVATVVAGAAWMLMRRRKARITGQT